MQLLSNQATLLIDPEVNANTWGAIRVLYEYEWGECYCTRFVLLLGATYFIIRHNTLGIYYYYEEHFYY